MKNQPLAVAVTAEKDEANTTYFILTALNELHIDFDNIGKLAEAGPLLDRLMRLAYEAGPDV
jgi:hypothetical protein